MAIKGSWAEPCPECGALDGCCATAKARLDTLNSLGQLVKRQSDKITRLDRELAEARQVINDRELEGIALKAQRDSLMRAA